MTKKKKKNKRNQQPEAVAHVVRVERDTTIEWPQLWMDVYLAGEDEAEDCLLRHLFARGGACRQAKTPDEADFVVFGGGPDVDPELYGASSKHTQTRTAPDRDTADLALYAYCLKQGIPMVGICRGAQFLHVMNGGSLYQHVDGHHGDHAVYLPRENRILNKVSSVHHQMCIQNDDMEIFASIKGKATEKWFDNHRKVTGGSGHGDVEAFFYPDTCCFGVQGHPEYSGYHEYACWFLEKIQEVVQTNANTYLDKEINCMRQKPSLVRKALRTGYLVPEVKKKIEEEEKETA